MIIDCFLFFNELDLLEIRLNALSQYVDRFVLCERPTTHSGNPKPLYFEDNKDRFKGFPIIHLIQPAIDGMKSTEGTRDGRAWKLEHRQRDYLANGFVDAGPEDMILLSDVDEIPNMKNWKGNEGAFKQKLYYYYVNCYTGVSNWKGTIAVKKKNIKDMNDVRNRRNQYPTVVRDGGWHFSTLGTPDNICYKIESFAHCELNKPEFKDRIAHNREHLLDPYNRGAENWVKNDGRGEDGFQLEIEDPSGPKWLLDNRGRYPDLWI